MLKEYKVIHYLFKVMKFEVMGKSAVKVWIIFSVAFCAFQGVQGTSLRLRQALLATGDWLNDVDGDNIPGQAGVDYPVFSSVPEGTSFRCRDYDFAGYFADIETDCQAYHVCFPDGRNASFLCVNGTVFHQRYFVCDWWFHFNCSHAPSLYDLNLFRKIPLPVLPPVQRRQFPGPAPQPRVHLPPPPPRHAGSPREPKYIRTDVSGSRDDDNDPNQKKKEPKYIRTDVSRSRDDDNDPNQKKKEPKYIRMDVTRSREDDNGPNQKRKVTGNNNELQPPNSIWRPENKKTSPLVRGNKHDDTCNCQCGSNPATVYVTSAVQYDNAH